MHIMLYCFMYVIKIIIIILLDLWHDTFRISGAALSLLKSYLHDRTQCVQIDRIMSEYAKLVCGVLQGSILGPLNFCMYMSPIGSILRHRGIDYHIYADDTQLNIKFDPSHASIALEKFTYAFQTLELGLFEMSLRLMILRRSF